MASLKSTDLRTLKGLVSGPGEGLETWQGERVKSNEELLIANFLFLNGVEYEYEKRYTGDIPDDLLDMNRRWYRPDFYLSEYDIWFEHFGIDRSGRPSWIVDAVEQQRYVDGMAWKRTVHQRCGTRLIESYSYWNDDQDLLNQVSNLLTSNGVILKPDTERNAENCRKLLRDKSFYSSVGKLIGSFITLAKANCESLVEVEDLARKIYRGNGTMWHRFQLFMTFTRPVMALYVKTLSDANQVDFDDMISLATKKVRSSGIDAHYRYIIVDEYQDISRSRLDLILAIREATSAKLMCVGDDWQAIYRFAGSDVTLFTRFEKLVGYHETMRIEHTYRNSQQLVDVASAFILKNDHQLPKKMQALPQKSIESPIAIAALNDMQAAFLFAVNNLIALPDRGGRISILGRNKRDLEKLFPKGETPNSIRIVSKAKKRQSAGSVDAMLYYTPDGQAEAVEMEYRTVHKSKGLEADNVIVLNLVNNSLGFPNMIEDDPILDLLLADSDTYPFSEERRLFYVALTRTKNYVWLICPGEVGGKGQSKFIAELDPSHDERIIYYAADDEMGEALCPVCGGTLLTDTNRKTGEKFVRCSNWPYCDKSYKDIRVVEDKKICPKCGGYMIRRTNSYTGEAFFGCTNWPEYCNYTCSVDAS